MFAKHDIPIFLAGWVVIWGTALGLQPSSLVLHLVAYVVIALAVSAHFIWEDLRAGRPIQWPWRGGKRRAARKTRATGS
jgi:hypothetical protein